ncbi:MAG: DEAD/DEAH box helicase [Planctomycetota bacterium]
MPNANDQASTRQANTRQRKNIQTKNNDARPEKASTFRSLGLSDPFLDTLTELGYETPTPIQARALPPALEGRDVLGLAQTGTGKTAAFALPALDKLHRAKTADSGRGRPTPRVLVLSPTRELATQIAESMREYCAGTEIRGCTVFGGVSQVHQVRKLRAGVDVIVATPGRLMDLLEQGHIDLSSIETFVLDEVDRMLDMGFVQPIRSIAAKIPSERQTLMFSATLPREIAKLASTLMRDPVKVEAPRQKRAEPKIEQFLHLVEGKEKPVLLLEMLSDHAVERAVVFTRTKHGADNLTRKLVRSGVRAESIHGNKSQNQRQRALDAFRSGRAGVLVATDVAARGLDIDGVTHVFNFNLPNEPEAYVHRIGRTGRAGAAGVAVAFCDPGEMAYLKAIEKLLGKRIPLAGGEPRPDEPAEREPRPERRPERRPRRERNAASEGSGGGGKKRPGGPKAGEPKRQRGGKRRSNAKAKAESATRPPRRGAGVRKPNRAGAE